MVYMLTKLHAITRNFMLYITIGGQAQGKGAGTQKTQQSEKSSKAHSKPTESSPNVAMANQIHFTFNIGDNDKQKQEASEGGSSNTSLNGTSTGKGHDRQADETTQAAKPTGTYYVTHT